MASAKTLKDTSSRPGMTGPQPMKSAFGVVIFHSFPTPDLPPLSLLASYSWPRERSTPRRYDRTGDRNRPGANAGGMVTLEPRTALAASPPQVNAIETP